MVVSFGKVSSSAAADLQAEVTPRGCTTWTHIHLNESDWLFAAMTNNFPLCTQGLEEALREAAASAGAPEASRMAAGSQADAVSPSMHAAQTQMMHQQEQMQPWAHTQQQLDQAQAQIVLLHQQTQLLPELREQLAASAAEVHEQRSLHELAGARICELEHQVQEHQQQLSAAPDRAVELAVAREGLSSMESRLAHHEALVQAFDAMAQHVSHLDTRNQELQLTLQNMKASASANPEDVVRNSPSSAEGPTMASLMHRITELEAEMEGVRANAQEQVDSPVRGLEAAALMQRVKELEGQIEAMSANSRELVDTAVGGCETTALVQRITELEAEMEGLRADAQEQVETAMRRQDDWRQHFKRHSTQLQVSSNMATMMDRIATCPFNHDT